MMSHRDESMIASRLARAAAICIAVLAPATSRAANAPLAVALEYSAPPDCAEDGEFKSIVIARLGYDAFREGATDRVIVNLALHGRTYEGHIEWRDAAGKWQGDRTFPSRSNDCRELTRAMAFALALQIQFLAFVGSASDASGAPPPAPAATTAAPGPPPAPPASVPPARQERTAPELTKSTEKPAGPASAPEFALGIGGAAGFGISSSMVELGRVFGSIAWPFLSLELAAELGLPANVRRQDGAGFSHHELLASLAGCGTVGRWSGCLIAKGGELQIAGRDIEAPASRSGPFLQTGLRLGVMQPLGHHAFAAARAEGLVTLTRWQVTLDQALVWTSPRLAGTLGLDVGVRFQ
jgi:hypothetical protein